MKSINVKLLRDLSQMKGQSLAIGAVVACGIAVFVMSMTTHRSLSRAKEIYYAENRFAEIFVEAVRAPHAVADRAKMIHGVARADHRVVEIMTLNMPDMAEPASGRAVSLPEKASSALNQIYLKRGRWPEADRKGEVIISEPFAKAHDIQLGDKLKAAIRGRRVELTAVGIALSPEYLIQIQPGSMFPDDKRFGIFWMARRQLETAADMEGAFNDLTLTLSKGANDKEVIRRLDLLLKPYGGSGAITRNSHQSARFIEDELKALRTMGMIPPLIFLSVAAFLLNISLRRILAMQREQIAALKAFGYTNLEIGWHYAKLTGVIVLCGSMVGCLTGTWMASGMISMYQAVYRFPVAELSPEIDIYLGALAMAMVAGIFGVFGGVRAAIKLPPAEAMRPAPPATYKPSLLEKFGLRRILSPPARMVIREIGRHPVKAMLTSLGIAFACAILIVGNFGKDSIDHLIDFQYSMAERDDARVQFVQATPSRAVHELEHIMGVIRAEPFRMVAARFRHGQRSKQLGITGIAQHQELFRLLDRDAQVIPLQGDGLVISAILAKILNLQVGDLVQVEILEGERPVREVKISGLVADFSGTAAYMNLAALNRLLGEGRVISGAYLQLDTLQENAVFTKLKDRPNVAGVSMKKVTIKSFMDTFAENLLRMRLFNVFFATVIAVGVVYSSARIAYSERSRDLATLRVIGLTKGEVSAIMLGELAVLTLIAIPVGIIIGFGLCLLMAQALETELYRIPFVIHPQTYGFASVIILCASIVSGLIVRRKISQLDMVTALKTRE
ncbi:MAG: FtsX-like permease family protein [Verrucomicrobiae bacterium]|nr:FtsX-like permease family protein [Verrucomicrobiae bacterium]NNJ85716.1 FtsX-like permease family protein [Akkermansiaceae bacterium]